MASRPKIALLSLLSIVLAVPTLLLILWFSWGIGADAVDHFASYLPATNLNVHGPLTLEQLRPVFPALQAVEDNHEDFQLARIALRNNIVANRVGNLQKGLAEIRVAERIRWRYSHEERMAILLNTAFFADDASGIESASELYFGTGVPQLDLAQRAMLVGLMKNPAQFSPAKHQDRCLLRRNAVLEEMKAQGSISAAQASQSESKPLRVTLRSGAMPSSQMGTGLRE